MRNLITLFCFMILLTNIVCGEVFTSVYLRDSNELLVPIDVNETEQYIDYGQIMAGTQLSIIIESDAVEEDKYMALYIEDDSRYYGELYARGDWMMGYPESIFDAAGKSTFAWISPIEEIWENKEVKGFSFNTGMDVSIGEWFIFDYNAVSVGDCNAAFYWFESPPLQGYGLVHELWFSHVPTRDFNTDGQVDLCDFSILAGYWYDSNCTEPGQCQGVNLDGTGLINIEDLALFADFWLVKTR